MPQETYHFYSLSLVVSRCVMVTLERIEVKGFKSIREMDLELSELNILIGANGSGKSNFLSVFRLLEQIAGYEFPGFVARSGGAKALLYFGPKTTSEMLIRLHFDGYGYESRLQPTVEDTLIFADESCWRDDPKNKVSLEGLSPSLHTESWLHDHTRQYGGEVVTQVLNRLKRRVYHFHDTGDHAGVRLTSPINDNAVLKPDASNLAAMLYLFREKHPHTYDNIVRAIRLAAPFFNDFTLRPDPLNPDQIRLEWQEKGSDAYFSASSLSDGTLRFMCLATLLMQPEPPSLVLIDEPELGLHPYAIVLLADMLRQVAAQTQVIVSTQSVSLVNQFEPEAIVVVDREGESSVFKRLGEKDIEGWLDEYGLGDLWEKNVIGGSP